MYIVVLLTGINYYTLAFIRKKKMLFSVGLYLYFPECTTVTRLFIQPAYTHAPTLSL